MAAPKKCLAKTSAGKRCKRNATTNGACEIPKHQAQVSPAEDRTKTDDSGLTVGQRQAVEIIAAAAPKATHTNLAKVCGVRRRATISEWLANSVFAEAVLRRRRELSRADYGEVIKGLTVGAKLGDVPAIRTWLEHHGLLKQQLEHSGPDGGPVETSTIDLSKLSSNTLRKVRDELAK